MLRAMITIVMVLLMLMSSIVRCNDDDYDDDNDVDDDDVDDDDNDGDDDNDVKYCDKHPAAQSALVLPIKSVQTLVFSRSHNCRGDNL